MPVSARADVHAHLSARRHALGEFFAAWGDPELDEAARADLVHSYLADALPGPAQRLGGTNSVHSAPEDPQFARRRMLVLGRHDTCDLARSNGGDNDESTLVGPGTASRIGPTVAFAEALSVLADSDNELDLALDAHLLSVGDDANAVGQATALAGSLPITPASGGFDAAFVTNAVAWDPFQPTQTVGARGRLLAELRLTSSRTADDFTTSGAVRNPLTTLVQLIGRLRDERGRIALPGFYDRALAPTSADRSRLNAHGFDPNAWADRLQSSRPGGTLSSTERAALWPGVSVLDVRCESPGGGSTPVSATAVVAFYLVPDQRHVDVERSLRAWFLDIAPADLTPGINIVDSTRPVRADERNQAVAAQRTALRKIHGRGPVVIPSGGMAGAGEIAFSLNAPVAFAGIAAPSNSWGSTTEGLSWAEFDAGVELAVETCLRLGSMR